MLSKKLHQMSYLFALFIFSLIILVPNLIKFKYGCFNAWDTGIYLEAIKKISLSNLNPMIEIHGYKIFNDHFDPILFFPAILKIIIPIEWTIFLTEIFFILLSTFPIILLIKKEDITASVGYFIIANLLFNQATLSAAYFPIHPTTWAMAPMSFLMYGLRKEKFKIIFWSLIFLMACKEEFPFVALATSAWLIFKSWQTKKNYLPTFIISVTSCVWFIFALKLRPVIFGGSYFNYGGIFLKNLSADPFNFIREYHYQKWAIIIKMFSPVIIMILLTRKNFKNLFWLGLFISTPPIILRILTGKFGYQYTAVILVPFLYLFTSRKIILAKKQIGILLTIVIIFASQIASEEIGSILKGETIYSCPINQIRLKDIKQIVEYDYSNCRLLITSGDAAFILVANGIDSRASNIDRIFDVKLLSNIKKNCYLLNLTGSTYPMFEFEVNDFLRKYNTIFKNDNFILLN